jgi:DNA-binding transcriptional regulator YiaG
MFFIVIVLIIILIVKTIILICLPIHYHMILDSIKLRKAREKSKLSQSELGLLINVSQTTIWEWKKKIMM